MNTRTPVAMLLLLTVSSGCAGIGGQRTRSQPLDDYFGVYRGGFDSAATDIPGDDLNFNPCQPTEAQPCLSHHAPLTDVLLALQPDDSGKARLAFYWNAEDLAAARPLDLLGRGCDTRIGPLDKLETRQAEDGRYLVARFPLETGNRLCLGKLRPTSRHHLTVELHADAAGEPTAARVLIDRAVRDENYLYVVEDGVRRRVKIDLRNTVVEDHERRYRVCIEDDYGDYGRCVLTDREFRSFALPLPVPGGAAVSYTWWQELQPRLRRTEGRFAVERYVGTFEPVASGERSP